MIKKYWLICLLFAFMGVHATEIRVKNSTELQEANKKAAPGDVIILENGEWKDVVVKLNAKGTATQPITFKAANAGQVIFTGQSRLMLGGTHLIVEGFFFTRGYAGSNEVIEFRTSTNELANHCRVTNMVVDDYNNPKRLDQNHWVAFYGKNNRLDHSTFVNKKNMGVLLAVMLDDDRSRENNHSIDHNHFGNRIPLASNTGETIRVGVSQHCEFNSNTLITDNYFENCDGETEIVSIKSGGNTIRNNLFKECQGSVVLRHGDNNTVENNVFLGNNKAGTGGVRVINKGQWVVNNLFYQCTGTGFRSPLAVMNGVPNSPAHRYVTAQDAFIANNSFYECNTLSFCEGSDAERSQTPRNILFANNIVYSKNGTIYKSFDETSGFRFVGNITGTNTSQPLAAGFTQQVIKTNQQKKVRVPLSVSNGSSVPNSLLQMATSRLIAPLQTSVGYADVERYNGVLQNALTDCGANWRSGIKSKKIKSTTVKAKNATELMTQLSKATAAPINIRLTGTDYVFNTPIDIAGNITISAKHDKPIVFSSTEQNGRYLFQVKGGSTFKLDNLLLNLLNVSNQNFIITDSSGSVEHANITLSKSTFNNYKGTLVNASKTSVCDSIVVVQNNFNNNTGTLFYFGNENDKKGLYNVEQLRFRFNRFNNHQGQLLHMLRGGNDESTMGPALQFNNNEILFCNAPTSLIYLHGTQVSQINNNKINQSNSNKVFILYEDIVKALHYFGNNTFANSGKVAGNQYLEEVNSKRE